MLLRRLIAFMLDLLVLALGGLAGFLVALFTIQSSNTIAGMGNVVVFFMLAAGGCAVVWVVLVWVAAVTGRSPGQRIMGLCYKAPAPRKQRAFHYVMVWLVPVVLVAVPAVSLNFLGQYRNDVQRAYEDHVRISPEIQGNKQDYDARLNALKRKIRHADRFAPEWLVGNDDIPWMLAMWGPLFIYVLANIVLLRRPPHAAVHDRISGARIVTL
jgi:hypothetical protein